MKPRLLAAVPLCALLIASGEGFAAGKRRSDKHKEATPAVEVVPAAPPRDEASRELTRKLWEGVLAASTMSSAQRFALAEQIHDGLNKKSFSDEDEGLFALSLAVLHSFDAKTRYAALPLVALAVRKNPALSSNRDIVEVWKILEKNFAKRMFRDETTLSGIAAVLDGPSLRESDPPRYSFLRGEEHYSAGRSGDALASFARVPIDSADYRQAKFLEAVTRVGLNQLNEARDALQMVIVLDPTAAEKEAGISSEEIAKLRELGELTVARILYEMGSFPESIAYYRTLMQDSHYFYESLAEQGWAFFMAGYPNRAMGAVYAAASPFFSDRFNPDVRFLDAAVSFWLCDFEEAHKKTQRFIEHSRNEGDPLISFVSRMNTYPLQESLERYARAVEDASIGVSAKNIGIGIKTLGALLAVDSVSRALEALNATIADRVKIIENSGYPAGKERLEWALREFEKTERLVLGAQVKAQMAVMKKDYDKAFMQSRVLFMEILTARKDLVMGRGRTVEGSQFVGSEDQFRDLGATISRNWVQDKSEYWFDELGHYVFRDRSRCGNGK